MLCELSWQAYFTPPLKDLSDSSEQHNIVVRLEDYVDMNDKGFKGLFYKGSTIFDIHTFVTKSPDHKYVIAFRGTASKASTKAGMNLLSFFYSALC